MAICVVTDLNEPGTPCGICHQTLVEFGDMLVLLYSRPTKKLRRRSEDQLKSGGVVVIMNLMITFLLNIVPALLQLFLFVVTGGRRNILKVQRQHLADEKRSEMGDQQQQQQQQKASELYNKFSVLGEHRLSVNFPQQPNTNTYYSNPKYSVHTRDWVDGKKWEFVVTKPQFAAMQFEISFVGDGFGRKSGDSRSTFWQWYRAKQIHILQVTDDGPCPTRAPAFVHYHTFLLPAVAVPPRSLWNSTFGLNLFYSALGKMRNFCRRLRAVLADFFLKCIIFILSIWLLFLLKFVLMVSCFFFFVWALLFFLLLDLEWFDNEDSVAFSLASSFVLSHMVFDIRKFFEALEFLWHFREQLIWILFLIFLGSGNSAVAQPCQLHKTLLEVETIVPLVNNFSKNANKIMTIEAFDKPDVHNRYNVYKNLQISSNKACEKFVTSQPDLIKSLREQKFDMVIEEQLNFCGAGLGHLLNIPIHVLVSSCPMQEHVASLFGLPFPSSYVPSLLDSDYSDKMSISERFDNILRTITGNVFLWHGIDPLTEIFRKHYGSDFPDLRDIVKSSPFVFVNVDELLDFPRPLFPNMINIGGLGMGESDQNAKLEEPFQSEMSKGKDGIIFVSLGTIIRSSDLPTEFRRNFPETFGKFAQYHFIMKTEKWDNHSVEIAAKFGNIFLTHWAPQNAILAHPG
uniref:glucuronosyltransferase n=1 Tax=Globodera rostochiensis TaxID=31243 RepID=A0A914HUQ2_GLORO